MATKGSANPTYTVAPGRTITTDQGHKGAGETVDLSDDEAERFAKLGFILDADGSRIVPTGGPAVNVVDGVRINP